MDTLSEISARAPRADLVDSGPRYFNRELSWLAFNRRVLEEACNPRHPLLERLRFLSISASNLDEFFMVRVAGLKAHQLLGVEERSADGLTPNQQLAAINVEADKLVTNQHEVWAQLQAALAEAEMTVIGEQPIEEAAETWLDQHFREQIFPVLTPQAIDPAHPFPFIPNRGLSLIFELRKARTVVRELLMAPASLPRFIRLPGEEARYISLETLIRRKTDYLFPKYEVLRGGAFRVIRDSDIEVEEEAEDLVRYFRTAIKRRRRGRVVRLELEPDMPDSLVQVVLEGLDAASAITSETRGFLGMSDLAQLVEEDRPDLKFVAFDPRFPERVREHGGDCFAAIKEKDILVHHPYESFEVVVEFIQQAAADPDVVAIKQALYRAGKQSAIIKALIDAAEAGKSVTAVVELKARFDEEQNLMWANALERAGVQVVYGFIDWKTHAKVSVVVRREEKGFRTYCHFGTGNYHPVSARVYTDLSYFTADQKIGRDAAKLFNYITGYLEPKNLRQLVISPHGHAGRAAAIARHRDRSREGRQALGRVGEDKRAGRPGDHRQAVRSEQRGSADRPRRPRHLLPPARRSGDERDHLRQVDRRPLPRACALLVLCQRRDAAAPRGQGLHQLGRLDAAQFRPPDRIYAADRESDGPRPAARPGDGRQPHRQ